MEKPEHKPTSQLPEGGNEEHRLPEEFKVNFDLPSWFKDMPKGKYEIDRNGDIFTVMEDGSIDANVVVEATQEMRAWIKDQNARILSQIKIKFPSLEVSHGSYFELTFADPFSDSSEDLLNATFSFHYENFIDGVGGRNENMKMRDGFMVIKVPYAVNING